MNTRPLTVVQPSIEWLRRDTSASWRLFCFHATGGGSAMFRPWAALLPHMLDLAAIELPGRGRLLNVPPFTQLEPLVEATASLLLPVLSEKRWVFFGHSLGALLCFELARFLRRHAAGQPLALVVSGRGAPQIAPHTAYHQLDNPLLTARLRTLSGTAKEMLDHPELMQLMLQIIRADFAVCETYIPQDDRPLDCPIYVYNGSDDPDVRPEHLDGWRAQTTSLCLTRTFGGDHFYLRTAQPALLQTLCADLQQATALAG